MKRALEIALVVGVLAIGGFILHAWSRRRALAARPPQSPSAAPGADMENPDAPPPLLLPPGGVSAVPALKVTRLPKPRHAAVPPPDDAKP